MRKPCNRSVSWGQTTNLSSTYRSQSEGFCCAESRANFSKCSMNMLLTKGDRQLLIAMSYFSLEELHRGHVRSGRLKSSPTWTWFSSWITWPRSVEAWKQRITQHTPYPGWSEDELRKMQTFLEDCFLRVCEIVFGKTENKFVGDWDWGRPIPLIIEKGTFTNIRMFFIAKDFSKWAFDSGKNTRLVRMNQR
jgi:hypothetical protein